MQLKAKEAFSWAHQGVKIEEFKEGQIIETEDEDLISVSLKEGWTEQADNKLTKKQIKEAVTQLRAEIESLGAKLGEVGDNEKPAIQAVLDEKKAELEALG